MNYRVTYCYEGRVTVEVEAADEDQAEKLGLAEADEAIHANLSVANVRVREK